MQSFLSFNGETNYCSGSSDKNAACTILLPLSQFYFIAHCVNTTMCKDINFSERFK